MMAKTAVVVLIRMYQKYFRQFMPVTCRFYPSCSEFACSAFEKYGLVKAVRLAAGRLLRCHPLSKKSGYDPVP